MFLVTSITVRRTLIASTATSETAAAASATVSIFLIEVRHLDAVDDIVDDIVDGTVGTTCLKF